MSKTVIRSKRTDLLYLFGATACAGLLYLGYLWSSKQPDSIQVPQSRSVQMQDANSSFARGVVSYQEGKFHQAIDAFQEAIRVYPYHEQAYINTSLAYAKLGNFDQAISHGLQATRINNNNHASHVMLGKFYEEIKQSEDAKMSYRAANKINPNLFESRYFLARLLTQEGTESSINEAIDHAKKAVSLSPNRDGYMILGDAYMMAGQPLLAREQYQKILEKTPKAADVLLAIGKTYERDQMIQDATNYYKEAIQIRPDYAQAHVSLAGLHFMNGNLSEGFKEYEWRWHLTNQPGLEKLKWDGTEPKGTRILLMAENGLGDILQYVRFAKTLKEKGATVIVHTPKALEALFRQCDYIDEVVLAGTENPSFDSLTSMQSIPYLFKIDSRTLPNKPYLKADQNLVDRWREVLRKDTNLKIGITWEPGDDSYLALDQKRTIGIEAFAPIAEMPGVSLYALQVGEASQKQIKSSPFKIHSFDGKDFDNKHGSFMDTSALMKNMDLVISVDTSIAHLAGALGINTWLILPYHPDVRWMKNGDKTLWYPSFTLFRQEKIKGWKKVMEQIKERVTTVLEHRAH